VKTDSDFLRDCMDVSPAVIRSIAERYEVDPDFVATAIAASIDDACFYINVVRERFPPGAHLLEAGAGLGLLTLLLERHGYSVSCLEPFSGPFSPYADVRRLMGIDDHALSGAFYTDMSQVPTGEFDGVVSFNVAEHVADIREFILGLAGALVSGGAMVVICPNYNVPYEPHVGAFFTRPISGESHPRLWRRLNRFQKDVITTLNYVTYQDIRALLDATPYRLSFDRAIFPMSVRRLMESRAFTKKHPHLSATSSRVLLRLASMVAGLVPARWLTPMLFEVHRPKESAH
jgi:SAM-dependent methyltransferase